jgi:SAM-dependent methyltransferase
MLKRNILDAIESIAKKEGVPPLLLMARPEFRQKCVGARWQTFIESNSPLVTYKSEESKASSTDSITEGTINHNIKGISNSIGSLAMLERSALLFRALMSIDSIYDYRSISVLEDLRILLIGSRTEYEVLLSLSYGFKEKNIFAIDIISYSKYITIADMHQMPFPDNFFDIVVCGWTLGYSNTPGLALAEITRVTRDGGYISMGQDVYDQNACERKFISANRPSTIDELLSLFPDCTNKSVIPIYEHNPSYPIGRIEGFLGHLLLTAKIQKKHSTVIF